MKIVDSIKMAYDRLTPLTRSGLILLLIVVPDWIARGTFWYAFAIRSIPSLKIAYASVVGKLSIIAIAFVLIWLDQRRLTRKRSSSPDPRSLNGRALQLREEMKTFLADAPQLVKDRRPSEDRQSFLTRAVEASGRHVDYLAHGYEWRFASRTEEIHHRYGERGVHSTSLDDGISKQFKDADSYESIIRGLGELAALDLSETEPRQISVLKG